jgi:putative membrane protein
MPTTFENPPWPTAPTASAAPTGSVSDGRDATDASRAAGNDATARATATMDHTDRTFELASRRTGLAIQRTRLAEDRTLMGVIRTSLSLIGFGFTIFQFFRYLRTNAGATTAVPESAAGHFGLALVSLGILMLVLGIAYHVRFAMHLRVERHHLVRDGLIHGELEYPISLTLVSAVVLLSIGLVAIFGMVVRVGPFH